MKHWPFKVISAEGGRPKVQIEHKGDVKTFFPEEVSSMVLIKMKETGVFLVTCYGNIIYLFSRGFLGTNCHGRCDHCTSLL
jgi:hypothetical protein